MRTVLISLFLILGAIALVSFLTEREVRSLGSVECFGKVGACYHLSESDKAISIFVKPKKLKASTPVDIEIVTKGIELESGQVKLEGLSHDMPSVLVPLNGKGLSLSGRGSFGICTEAYMIWRAHVRFSSKEITYIATLDLRVENE